MTFKNLVLFGTLLFTSSAFAGEKKLMHCFAFTPIASATDAEWQAFYAATDALPSKIPAISHVWYGKLASPLTQFQVDQDAAKKLRAGDKDVMAKANRVVREYGVCMEMANAAALDSYKDLPAHKTWSDAYEKVRVAGTTTYNIIGQ